nr:response regulator [Kouleothrix sp.]
MKQLQQLIRVLIVDDHMMVRDGLKVFLSLFSDLAVVAEATNGAQAIERCRTYQPDVVLMDIAMPEMDGAAATAYIRAEFPGIRVIALTSLADETCMAQMLQAGAIGYLHKDVDAERLAAAIRDAASGRTVLATVAQALERQGALREAAHSAGLLVATAGADVVRLLPPLIAEHRHVDEL